MANEIASAYLTLYARMPGVQKDIAGQLGAVDADKVGQDLGKQTGAGYTKGFAAAGAVGGLVATLATGAASAIGDLVGDAVAASDATSKFAKTLGFAGVDTKTITKLQKSTKAYADDTVYDLGTVQSTTAQLAANGVKDYDKLTEAAGNLNAVAGGNQETFGSVAMVLTQTAGAGKLTTENWNQLADAITGASGVLQAALEKNGAYTGNFRDAMEKGQISSDEFNTALMELGSQPVAVEAAKSTETMEGALGGLSATIVGGLASAIGTVKPMLTDFINGAAAGVKFIVDNIGWIGPLAVGIGIAALAWGAYTVVMGIVAAYTTAAAAAQGGLTVAQWLLNAAMSANPIGLIIVGIGLLIGAIILLVMNWDTVVAFLKTVWDGFVSWFMGVMDGFLGWWGGIWDGIFAIIENIQTAFGIVFTAIGDIIRGAFDGVVDFIKGVINGIIDAVNGAIGGISDVAGAVGGAFGMDLSIGKIPRLAEGGVISRRPGGIPAVIGEGRYDEAVVPLSPGVLSQLGGGGGDFTQIINAVQGQSAAEIAAIARNDRNDELRGM